MEVATIITSNPEALVLFDTYIYTIPFFEIVWQDGDTVYFGNIDNSKDKLFYHFILNDTEEEFSYNYKDTEISFIKEFFGPKGIYMIDLSYKDESTLQLMFKEFKKYLIEQNETLIQEILISHPFDGVKILERDY